MKDSVRGKAKILIVDDEPYVADGFSSILQAANISEIIVCTDPTQSNGHYRGSRD